MSKKAFENIQLEIRDTINRLKCIQVVMASSRHGDVRFLCRVNDENRWFMILDQFLMREANKGWYSFFGKKYFKHQGKLTYGWVIVFESEDLDKASVEIRKMFAAINDDIFGNSLEDVFSEHESLSLDWNSDYYNEKISARVSTIKG